MIKLDKIIFLGTGSGSSLKFYNSCFALQKNDDYMLIDGGGGIRILEQLNKANIPFKSIRNIFVTHNHIDHIVGIIWIIRKLCIMMREGKYDGSSAEDKTGYSGEVNIYASNETIEAIRTLSKLILAPNQSSYIDDRIKLNVVQDREKVNILEEEFIFYDTKAKKNLQYGFKVNMSNGKSLACNGDETYNEANYDLLKDADYFIHEAFCLESEREEKYPHKIGHATSKEVCEIANELDIKNLIFYHISNDNFEGRKEIYINENKDYFNGNLYVPNDLEIIDLN